MNKWVQWLMFSSDLISFTFTDVVILVTKAKQIGNLSKIKQKSQFFAIIYKKHMFLKFSNYGNIDLIFM